MKTREIVCVYYTYEGGPCDKRGISAHFRQECQTCKKYQALKGAKPARTDNRKAKMEKINKKEMRKWD